MRFLHVGCGPKRKSATTPGFNTEEWLEVRFDIDPSVKPEIIGSMTDLSSIEDNSLDAIFSSHNIEHLYPHEVSIALSEFFRVLRPKGFLVVTCPDLRSVCELIGKNLLTEPAYHSPAGPIAPLDILYGHRPQIARGNLFMAHRTGFTQNYLVDCLNRARFSTVASLARGRAPFFDLWAVATKTAVSEDEIKILASGHFPR